MYKFCPKFNFVAFFVCTFFATTYSYGFTADIYVDKDSIGGTCNNGNAGSISSPLCTIAQAHTNAVAGDTIIVRAGTYPSFTLTKDGTSGSRITFQAYTGETVIVDAAGSGNGIWMDRTDYVTLKGFTVKNAGGDYDAGIKVGRFEAGTISTTNNIVENCTVQDSINGANNVYGIIVQNGSSNIIRNNTVTNSYLSGITVLANSGGAAVNNEIRNNTSYNNTGSGGDSDGIKVEGANITGTIIANNTVYGNSDDGIDTWTSHDNIVEYNIVYNQSGAGDGNGFKMGGSTTGGSNIVRFNIAYGNQYNGFDSNGSGGNIYYHNVSYNNTNYGFEDEWRNGGITGTSIFKNNIGFNNTSKNFSAGSYTATSNYNLWFSTGGNAKASYNGTTYTTIAAFNSASGGLDANSISNDPLFTNAGSADFTLQATSPAIDAGDPANPASVTVSGDAPDIGRYEYDQSEDEENEDDGGDDDENEGNEDNDNDNDNDDDDDEDRPKFPEYNAPKNVFKNNTPSGSSATPIYYANKFIMDIVKEEKAKETSKTPEKNLANKETKTADQSQTKNPQQQQEDSKSTKQDEKSPSIFTLQNLVLAIIALLIASVLSFFFYYKRK